MNGATPSQIPPPVAARGQEPAPGPGPAGGWRRLGARVCRLGALALVLGVVTTARAAETTNTWTAAFDAANRLYEQARYREAAAAYEALLAQGLASPALYFNLGNAWFKAGEAGRAILNYRLAERLAPRDPDIRANLRLTRELVHGQPPPSPPWWRRLSRRFTLNEWAGATGVALWLCFGALGLGELRADRRRLARRWAAGFGAVALLAGAALWGQWLERRLRVEAVVVAKQAVVRYGPLEVSPELQKVEDGTELEVLDQKDGWLQVGGLARGTGWIRQSEVLLVPP
jgi:tetratricopeptide (TPR) repeat protein